MTLYKVGRCRRYYCSHNIDWKPGKEGRCEKQYVNGEYFNNEFTCYSADMGAWNKKESAEEQKNYADFPWFQGKRIGNIKRK